MGRSQKCGGFFLRLDVRIYVLDSDLYRGHRPSLGDIKSRDRNHPLPILNFEKNTRDLSFPGVSFSGGDTTRTVLY